MKNETLNDKIVAALKDDNIVRIMNDASKRFRNQLDTDSIYTCQINALWKSFVNYNPNKNTKFTTYLYNGIFIECLKEVKFQGKLKNRSCSIHDNIPHNRTENLIFECLDELKSEEERSLFLDRISNMTISEIAKKHDSNRETVRKKIKNIGHKLSKNFK